MAQRYLTIMEVSQKQAFIFSSNRLRKNVENSNIIAWIMDPEYFEKTIARFCIIYEGKESGVFRWRTYSASVRYQRCCKKFYK